ncbi:hypothetical protein LOD99_9083 [Oopsacas minuta]|uniref:Uncharacterized protein n=1 Tax=Oopsacas minuta TaxID=111878 RepID=A0AAV7JDS7_9METZ|nr:hypothetical protein LOD99_9083 [Oopsacas minuta]
MVSNIIYRAIPFPVEEVLTDSLPDNDTFHQYSSQLLVQADRPTDSIPLDDLSICNLSTESLTSEIAYVCIDSSDSLEKEAPSNVVNLNKRKAKPKRVKKQLNCNTIDPIKRVPLDVVYGNSLLENTMDIKPNSNSTEKDKETPVFLSVTDMIDFEQHSKPDNSLRKKNVSNSNKQKRMFEQKKVQNGKSSRTPNPKLILGNSINFNNNLHKPEYSKFTRIARLRIRRLSLKTPELKLQKLVICRHSNYNCSEFKRRVPMLNLKRVLQLSSPY